MAVVVQDHVHAGGALQVGVEVNPVQAGRGVLAHQLLYCRRPAPGGARAATGARRGIELSGQLAPHVIQGIGEEAAAAAGGIQDVRPVGWVGQVGSSAGVQHLDHQADDIGRA